LDTGQGLHVYGPCRLSEKSSRASIQGRLLDRISED
jgi:hypothetical protein